MGRADRDESGSDVFDVTRLICLARETLLPNLALRRELTFSRREAISLDALRRASDSWLLVRV